LRAAYVQPQYLEPHHLVGAAHLMAKEGFAPVDAYEHVVMQSGRQSGLLDDGDFHDAFGMGASDEVQRGAAPADVAPFVPAPGADAQPGAPPGAAQAGARVRGLGQAGGGGAIAEWADNRESEWAPPVRIAAEAGPGAQPIARGGSTDIPRGSDADRGAHFGADTSYAQTAPGDFEIEHTQQSLTPDQVNTRLNAADKPRFFLGPDGTVSIALNGDFAPVGKGGTVTNGQVITVTPQGNVLTTVTKDSAVSIGDDARSTVIRLRRT
jgi:hypothetical protein